MVIYSKTRGKDYIELMLNGVKTVDVKLYYNRIAPYGYVKAGDMMYIKVSSGPIVGRVRIPQVKYYEISNHRDIFNILLDIQDRVGLENREAAQRMYEKTKSARYVTVFEIDKPERAAHPYRILKSDRRVWVPNFYPSEKLLSLFWYLTAYTIIV